MTRLSPIPDFDAQAGLATSSASADESALIEQARRDPEAFGALYRKHAPAIQRYLRRRLGDVHLVEDALGETFVAALKGLSKYESRGVPFRAWLYRLATGTVTRSRRQRALVALQDCEEFPGQESPAVGPALSEEASESAREALLRLAPRFQSVLSLHYLEGMSVEQVARVLRCKPGTVKSRLARGREALRKQLERQGWKS